MEEILTFWHHRPLRKWLRLSWPESVRAAPNQCHFQSQFPWSDWQPKVLKTLLVLPFYWQNVSITSWSVFSAFKVSEHIALESRTFKGPEIDLFRFVVRLTFLDPLSDSNCALISFLSFFSKIFRLRDSSFCICFNLMQTNKFETHAVLYLISDKTSI